VMRGEAFVASKLFRRPQVSSGVDYLSLMILFLFIRVHHLDPSTDISCTENIISGRNTLMGYLLRFSLH
jgi:hypothetical protein